MLSRGFFSEGGASCTAARPYPLAPLATSAALRGRMKKAEGDHAKRGGGGMGSEVNSGETASFAAEAPSTTLLPQGGPPSPRCGEGCKASASGDHQ